MPRRNRTGLIVAAGLVVLTVVRLWLGTRFELVGDEAYYWQWSQHPAWCYYSKGPLVAWTIRLGTLLFGDTVLGIRFVAIGLGTATLGLLYGMTRRLLSPRIAVWTLVLAACTPLFVIGGYLMTIDPLLIFFWLAATAMFWRAKQTDRVRPWMLTGLFVGLGMLAKYTCVALLPCFALFLAWSPPYRHHLRRKPFWLMLGTALLFLVPVLWWNAQHGWITLVHLRERGALDAAWTVNPSELLTFLGAQLAAYSPLFLLGMLFSLGHGHVRRNAPAAYRLLVCLVVPLLVFYLILALNDAGEANWTAAAVMSGLPLLAATWIHLARTSRIARIAAWLAVGPSAVLAVLLLVAPATQLPGIEPLLYRVRGWGNLAARVHAYQQEEGLDFVIGDHYQIASLLAFYLPDRPPTYIVDRPRIQNQYSFWPTYGPPRTGTNAVYVTRHTTPPFALHQQFRQIGPPQEVWSHWRGRPVQRFHLYPCRGYRQAEPSSLNYSPTHSTMTITHDALTTYRDNHGRHGSH